MVKDDDANTRRVPQENARQLPEPEDQPLVELDKRRKLMSKVPPSRGNNREHLMDESEQTSRTEICCIHPVALATVVVALTTVCAAAKSKTDRAIETRINKLNRLYDLRWPSSVVKR